MRRIVTVVCILSLMILYVVPSNAYTTRWTGRYPMGDGKAVSYYSSKTNYLWIGDSRMVQMYGYSGKDSVVACWGAHYNDTRVRIDSASRMKDIKKIIKKHIKKFGVSNVVLVPVINDYTGPRAVKSTISNYMATYKRIKRIAKDIHIITPSLIKKYGGISCKPFNSVIKKMVMDYIPVQFKAKHYNLRLGDRVHYSPEGLKYIRKIVHKATNGDPEEKFVDRFNYMMHSFR